MNIHVKQNPVLAKGLTDDVSYCCLPLMTGYGPFDVARLNAVIEALNQAWDQSPRVLLTRFEVYLPENSLAGVVPSVKSFIVAFFEALDSLIKREIEALPSSNNVGRLTRTWGVWAMDGSGAGHRLQVAVITNFDACYQPGRPDATERRMAQWISEAYEQAMRQCGREAIGCIHFVEKWIHLLGGYQDLAGYQEAFRQLSLFCGAAYPKLPLLDSSVFGCGLYPSRLTDAELYPDEAFIIPPQELAKGHRNSLVKTMVSYGACG
ncbi:MAG: hypothetical protein VR73_10275 [Gammaproteobacteria bacterium BRH_c0]|nr:MAG: hypothetical protein VR73_10275 [Gammaproteobacteria bacterium BRH_c0]